MKKAVMIVTTLGFLSGATAIQAGVTPDVQKAINEFQGYFKNRFPSVSLAAYNDGVNALPQYAERRANWEILMEFPPYEPDMDKAPLPAALLASPPRKSGPCTTLKRTISSPLKPPSITV